MSITQNFKEVSIVDTRTNKRKRKLPPTEFDINNIPSFSLGEKCPDEIVEKPRSFKQRKRRKIFRRSNSEPMPRSVFGKPKVKFVITSSNTVGKKFPLMDEDKHPKVKK